MIKRAEELIFIKKLDMYMKSELKGFEEISFKSWRDKTLHFLACDFVVKISKGTNSIIVRIDIDHSDEFNLDSNNWFQLDESVQISIRDAILELNKYTNQQKGTQV